jgi:hypothetical protein
MSGLLAASPVWHYWVGVALTILTVLFLLGVIVGYFVKVVRPRYPKR